MTKIKQWRSLIRVVGFNNKFVYVIIPSWDTKLTIAISLKQLPNEIQHRILQKQERFHAKVNIDVMTKEELIFSNWKSE